MDAMLTVRQPQTVALSSVPTVPVTTTSLPIPTDSAASVSFSPSSASVTSMSSSTTHDNLPGRPTDITDTATTSATATSSSTPDGTSRTLTTIYPTFFAIFIVFGALAGFLVWHRRRRHVRRGRAHRRGPLSTVTTAAPTQFGSGGRREAWLGRWRSAEVSREEGLNEEGEAPPPYMPKSDEEPGRRGSRSSHSEINNRDGPAVPLQTLSRENAGFKPPDYVPHVVEVTSEHESSSRPSAGQSSSANAT